VSQTPRLVHNRNRKICHPERSKAQPKDLRLLFVCSIQTVPEKRVTSELTTTRAQLGKYCKATSWILMGADDPLQSEAIHNLLYSFNA
jgi:hypothetical protein